jgi:hypothetical protein
MTPHEMPHCDFNTTHLLLRVDGEHLAQLACKRHRRRCTNVNADGVIWEKHVEQESAYVIVYGRLNRSVAKKAPIGYLYARAHSAALSRQLEGARRSCEGPRRMNHHLSKRKRIRACDSQLATLFCCFNCGGSTSKASPWCISGCCCCRGSPTPSLRCYAQQAPLELQERRENLLGYGGSV